MVWKTALRNIGVLEQLLRARPLVFVVLQTLGDEVGAHRRQVPRDFWQLFARNPLNQVSNVFYLGPRVVCGRQLNHGLAERPNITSSADGLVHDYLWRHPQNAALNVREIDS